MNALQTHFWAVREYLAPVLRESKFKEHGRITPGRSHPDEQVAFAANDKVADTLLVLIFVVLPLLSLLYR